MQILWKATLQVNILRLICAGIVWMVILSLIGSPEAPMALVAIPLGYTPFALLAMLLNRMGIGGLFSLAALLLAVPGDPLMFLLRIASPQLVPMQYYSPIVWAYFLYVKSDLPA
jgi:hypothetical protein